MIRHGLHSLLRKLRFNGLLNRKPNACGPSLANSKARPGEKLAGLQAASKPIARLTRFWFWPKIFRAKKSPTILEMLEAVYRSGAV